MTLDDYQVVLYRNQPAGWVAEVPAIKGCYALMASRQEALSELTNVFEMIAAEYAGKGAPLPADRNPACLAPAPTSPSSGYETGLSDRS